MQASSIKEARNNMNAMEQIEDLCAELGVPKAATPKAYSPTPEIRCYCPCDFRRLPVKPNSVRLVCTDIPYDDEWLREVPEFGAWCARALKPNGVLVTFYGHQHLVACCHALEQHLRYRWQLFSPIYGVAPSHGAFIARYQLALVFAKDSRWRPRQAMVDIMPAGQRTKRGHPHRKTLSQMQFLVEAVSDEGDLIADPCAGGWTTAEACWNTHRKFVGSDLDPSCLGLARRRFQALGL
jgi:hypothetical protein